MTTAVDLLSSAALLWLMSVELRVRSKGRKTVEAE